MNKSKAIINRLFSIRNHFGNQFPSEKLQLLDSVNIPELKDKRTIRSFYSALLFMTAWPDNKTIYQTTNRLLQQLQAYVPGNENVQYRLYNTGINGTYLCAAFSFEMVKWMRETRRGDTRLSSFEAGDAQVQSILSVVMTKTESEIMQDANAEWKGWLKHLKKPGEDLLDQFIAIFESSNLRPEVKEEYWNTLGVNVEIYFPDHCCLPASLTENYYHRSLIRSDVKKINPVVKPRPVNLTAKEAEQILDRCRMVLVRKLRELDPISFTTAKRVSYYHLPRGISIALMGMEPAQRHPVDSYMGYLVFKNGLPVAYAGSWILFDSARIGLNVFDDYRGGEAKYIFEQVLQLHSKVYGLNRFSVDPYQLGKENSDGIHSGAFWIYYHAGFRPLQKEQQELAVAEAAKIKADKRYRSPVAVLKKLAASRMELVLKRTAVHFDATDLSRLYASILTKKYGGNRIKAGKNAAKKLAAILGIKIFPGENMNYILTNWAVLLLSNESELRSNASFKKILKKLFLLKATGSEEEYIKVMQGAVEVRRFIEALLKKWR
ncbi:MAG: hypothetical protein IPL50_04695 [Chitinophagaceae bacterium]|nr:hypothetical protein [Chitinophagaceae bacterium]